jgi:hypothetical protein
VRDTRTSPDGVVAWENSRYVRDLLVELARQTTEIARYHGQFFDSPIEYAFFLALRAERYECPPYKVWESDLAYLRSIGVKECSLLVRDCCDDIIVATHPKIQVNGKIITPDFAFVVAPYAEYRKHKMCVELDGHDFHERTKAQASRDKRRDRDLLSAGWPVVRFSGSDVARDVTACVSECENLLLQEPEEEARGA